MARIESSGGVADRRVGADSSACAAGGGWWECAAMRVLIGMLKPLCHLCVSTCSYRLRISPKGNGSLIILVRIPYTGVWVSKLEEGMKSQGIYRLLKVEFAP